VRDSLAAVQPSKTHDIHNCAMDSTRWDGFEFRDGDIVIAAWAKSGTTWTQQIVGQLIFKGADDIAIDDLAPWVELRIVPRDRLVAQIKAQTHRRFFKTHLPADALVFSSKAKYIYLGRDGRDVAWSMYNHLMRMTPEFYSAFNDTPGRVGPAVERPKGGVRQFFHDWLDDAVSLWPYWSNVQSWWNVRDVPNVMLLHFSDLKADLPGQIRRIAEFIEIEIDEQCWPAIVEHCTFDYMKANADRLSTVLRNLFEGGMRSFIYKGTNGRWRDTLSLEEIQRYEDTAKANLTPDCAHWLATGERLDRGPNVSST
jgi:aryl sulfotransferase